MNRALDLLAAPDTTIAVVGATDSPGKYGGIVYRDLRARGHHVVAVNPRHPTVAGDPAVASVTDVSPVPTIVNLVVPARAGLEVVRDAARIGDPLVWLQPGADDPEVVAAAEALGLDVVAGDCIMVASRLLAARS